MSQVLPRSIFEIDPVYENRLSNSIETSIYEKKLGKEEGRKGKRNRERRKGKRKRKGRERKMKRRDRISNVSFSFFRLQKLTTKTTTTTATIIAIPSTQPRRSRVPGLTDL